MPLAKGVGCRWCFVLLGAYRTTCLKQRLQKEWPHTEILAIFLTGVSSKHMLHLCGGGGRVTDLQITA